MGLTIMLVGGSPSLLAKLTDHFHKTGYHLDTIPMPGTVGDLLSAGCNSADLLVYCAEQWGQFEAELLTIAADIPLLLVFAKGLEPHIATALRSGVREYVVADDGLVYLDIVPTLIERALSFKRLIGIEEKYDQLVRRDHFYQQALDVSASFAYLLNIHANGEMSFESKAGIMFDTSIDPDERFSHEPLLNGVHPDYIDQVATDLDQAVGGRTSSSIVLYRNPDGGYIWVEINRVPLWNEDQTRVVQVLGVVTNIDEQISAKVALQENVYLLTQSQQLARMGSWHSDLVSRQLRWSDETYKIFSLESGRPITFLDFLELVHPEDRNYVEMISARSRDHLTPYDIYHRILRADGVERLVHQVARVEADSSGRPLRMYGIIHDITEEYAVQQELIESKSRLSHILNTVGDGVWSYDLSQSRYLYASSAMQELFGQSVEALFDRNADISRYFDEDACNMFREGLEVAYKAGRSEFELQIQHPDTGKRWVRVKCAVTYDMDNLPLRIDGIITDIDALKRIEGKLRQSEQQLLAFNHQLGARVNERTQQVQRQASAMDAAIEGMALLIDDRYTYMNTSHAVMCGYEPGELIGRSWTELYTPDMVEYFRKDVFKQLEEVGQWSGEVQMLHKDGHFLDTAVGLTFSPLGDLICTCRDITERKQAEANLAQTQRILQLTLSTVPDAINIFDVTKKERLFSNRSIVEDFGYTKQDVIEMGSELLHLLIHPDDLDYYRAHQQRVLNASDGEIDEMEIRMRTKEGDWRWVYSRYAVFRRDDDGNVIEILGVSQDITTRKQQEADLEASYNLIEHVLDAIPVDVFWKDKELRIVGCNQKFADFVSLGSPKEVIGKTGFDFAVDDTYATIGNRSDKLIISGQEEIVERLIKRTKPDGTTVWYQTTKLPLKDKLGEISGVLGVRLDLTEIQQAKHELERALMKERELSELKSRFVSMTSHEFRTPLATISAGLQTLEEFYDRMSESGRAVRYQRIYDQIQHMVNMLDDILLIGQIDDGRRQLRYETFRVDEFFLQLIEEFQQRNLTHRITAYFPNSPVHISADRKLIQQIFTNLVSNALKYSPHGGAVDIELEYISTREILLQVRDEGIGIPKAEVKHIFEPFHRAQNAEAIKGTGLGLAIVRTAIAKHRGTISVRSQLQGGTTFFVRLPTMLSSQLETPTYDQNTTH